MQYSKNQQLPEHVIRTPKAVGFIVCSLYAGGSVVSKHPIHLLSDAITEQVLKQVVLQAIESRSGVNVLGLIVFCLTFGVIIGRMGEEGRILVNFFVAANEAVMKMVYIIIWYVTSGTLLLLSNEGNFISVMTFVVSATRW